MLRLHPKLYFISFEIHDNFLRRFVAIWPQLLAEKDSVHLGELQLTINDLYLNSRQA